MFKLPRKFSTLLVSLAGAFLLASCAMESTHQSEVAMDAPAARQQSMTLGTQWGEEVSSPVNTVDLRRVSNNPVDVVEIQYAANQVRGSQIQSANIANGRIQVSVLNERGAKWPLTQDGRYLYLKGRNGERYKLQYRNLSSNTYEIVATVDGLDVLNGQPGSVHNSGYVLRPNGTLVIEGFRQSQNEVAAFRFSAPDDAYAANTSAGDPRNIGVIGTAVFVLDDPAVRNNNTPNRGQGNAFPADRSNDHYAKPPKYGY